MPQDATLVLASQEMALAWSDAAAWTVLDTDFGDGKRFLEIQRLWRTDVRRPRMLHYVGITAAAQPIDSALGTLDENLGPGFHRLIFDAGRISLTLCVGEITATLAEHNFRADTVFTGVLADKWGAQVLARRCKRKTVVHLHETLPTTGDFPAKALADLQTAWLKTAGFVNAAGKVDTGAGHFLYDPPWDIQPRRPPGPQGGWAAERSAQVKEEPAQRAGDTEQNALPPNRRAAPNRQAAPDPKVAPNPGRCAVVGAGIAGASVARALALRGWQVSVFDQEAMPAAQASSLPVGLAVPHVSADDNPRSRLTRSGTRMMVQHARALLNQGEDWAPSGVLERKTGAAPVWHPEAAWIKPAAMVRALLKQPGISFHPLSNITALHHHQGQWLLATDQGPGTEPFHMVVLANALGCKPLLEPVVGKRPFYQRICDLQAVHGAVSTGHYLEKIAGLPSTPVNGHGCFVPSFPAEKGEHWLVGASFEADTARAADLWTQHTANMARLEHLAPPHGTELADTLERGPVTLWSATRCVTHDRLPLVGPVDTDAAPGLWLCVGMGSRGLSFSALCAELLAARLGGEPLPMEARLARSLDAQRHRRATSGKAGR